MGTRLLRTTLFQALPPASRSALLTSAQRLRYDRGSVLFHEGAPAQDVWIVLKGWVHLVRQPASDHGHPVVLCTITPRDILCGLSALELDTYSASGMAGTDSEVLRIPGPVFKTVLMREPFFAYQALRLCAERIRHMAAQYSTMAEPVARRIVRTIVRLQQQFGTTIPVTHRELAQMSWTTTETAIRMVRQLKRQGIVSGSRGRLLITRPKALKARLSPLNGHGHA